MAAALSFIVTDFKKVQPALRFARQAGRTTGYYVRTASLEAMKNTDPSEDSINGITRLITEFYFKDRYTHVLTLSLYDETDNFLDVETTELDNTMEILENAYNEEHPVLFINIIPREIYKNSIYPDRDGEDTCDIFRRYGFINIGCKIHNIDIPKYVMIKANDIGAVGIVENEKEIW